MARELERIAKKRELPPIQRVPDDPSNKFITKEMFLKKRQALREAQRVADDAFRKAINSIKPENIALKEAEAKLIESKQLLATLVSKKKGLEEELAEAGQGETRPIKMQIGKVVKQIEETEVKIKEREDAVSSLK